MWLRLLRSRSAGRFEHFWAHLQTQQTGDACRELYHGNLNLMECPHELLHCSYSGTYSHPDLITCCPLLAMLSRMVLDWLVSPEPVKDSFNTRGTRLGFTAVVQKQPLFFADFERRYLQSSRLQAAAYVQALTSLTGICYRLLSCTLFCAVQ